MNLEVNNLRTLISDKMVKSSKCYEKGNCIYCGESSPDYICEKCMSTKEYDFSIAHDYSERRPCVYKRKQKTCPDFEPREIAVNVYEGNILRMSDIVKATKFNIWREKRFLKKSVNCKFMLGLECYKGVDVSYV